LLRELMLEAVRALLLQINGRPDAIAGGFVAPLQRACQEPTEPLLWTGFASYRTAGHSLVSYRRRLLCLQSMAVGDDELHLAASWSSGVVTADVLTGRCVLNFMHHHQGTCTSASMFQGNAL
jgi:hypothetical protein